MQLLGEVFPVWTMLSCYKQYKSRGELAVRQLLAGTICGVSGSVVSVLKHWKSQLGIVQMCLVCTPLRYVAD